jgi:hypothetical protein
MNRHMQSDQMTVTTVDESSSNDEFEAMYEHVCENAEYYGAADEEDAYMIAILLGLEEKGKVYRTGEKELTSKGLWQDVFAARQPS